MEANNNKKLSNSVSNIPEEIMSDILARVPARSLLKFKFVCKSWLSLIKSYQFIKTHLNVSSNNLNNHSLIRFDPYRRPVKFFTCSISSFPTITVSVNPIILDFHFQEPIVRVVGSCNGLLCVSTTEKSLILCNPVTKKCKSLMLHQDASPGPFGFCYDKLNDDYKVVKLSSTKTKGAAGYHTKAEVYSLRDDYWTEIDGFEGYAVPFYDGICVGGIIHWSWFPNYGSRVIISLNIATYEFRVVLLPVYDQTANGDDRDVDSTLGEFGGCLAIICDYYKVRVDVWVMKEYGVTESWFKLVSIPLLVAPPYIESLVLL